MIIDLNTEHGILSLHAETDKDCNQLRELDLKLVENPQIKSTSCSHDGLTQYVIVWLNNKP